MQFIFRYFVARTLYYLAKVVLRMAGRAIFILLRFGKKLLLLFWRSLQWLDSRTFYWHPYVLGYQGALFPRWIRRLFARTHWHRCWLSGHMGIRSEQDRHYGVCDRDWYRTRAR